jgi:hypothetical protein
MFDGGHDLFGAWSKVKDSLPDDTFAQEVTGYMQGLWKDLTTQKGLPFATLEQANYEEWVEKISSFVPGVSKEYLYDLCSYDALEIFSTALGAVAVIFSLNNQDKQKVSEILGAMSITSIISANPIMGLVTIALCTYSYKKKKMSIDKVAAMKSGSVVIVSAVMFSVLGLPFLIELVLVMVVANLFKKKVLGNEELLALVKKHASLTANSGAEVIKKSCQLLINKIEAFETKQKTVTKKAV